MNIYEISGRHLEITEAMKTYVSSKLESLDHFSSDVIDAKVVISYSGATGDKPHKVEIQLNLPNTMVRAEERSGDAYQAIDAVVAKLERQLKRYEGRRQDKRKESKLEFESSMAALPQVILPSGISRIKKHVLRPMTPDDAIFQMELLGHTFYMFRNINNNDINVVYLRHDGSYGLLQAAD